MLPSLRSFGVRYDIHGNFRIYYRRCDPGIR